MIGVTPSLSIKPHAIMRFTVHAILPAFGCFAQGASTPPQTAHLVGTHTLVGAAAYEAPWSLLESAVIDLVFVDWVLACWAVLI